MARPQPAAFDKKKVVAENRRARFDYAIESTYEAGLALTGTEVKSLRFGEGSIAESYAQVNDEEVWLINANIPEFSHGNRFNHEPKRPRKLLLTPARLPSCTGRWRGKA
jgi:SsrA-binding protein